MIIPQDGHPRAAALRAPMTPDASSSDIILPSFARRDLGFAAHWGQASEASNHCTRPSFTYRVQVSSL